MSSSRFSVDEDGCEASARERRGSARGWHGFVCEGGEAGEGWLVRTDARLLDERSVVLGSRSSYDGGDSHGEEAGDERDDLHGVRELGAKGEGGAGGKRRGVGEV